MINIHINVFRNKNNEMYYSRVCIIELKSIYNKASLHFISIFSNEYPLILNSLKYLIELYYSTSFILKISILFFILTLIIKYIFLIMY